MHTFATLEAPPTDFVAFLAQRGGLSPEAAEHRLECWFGEYQAASTPRQMAESSWETEAETNC